MHVFLLLLLDTVDAPGVCVYVGNVSDFALIVILVIVKLRT